MRNIIPESAILDKKMKKSFKKGKRCALCGYKGKLTVDHIIKKEYYHDSLDISNWQVLCDKCHIKKTRCENLILSGQIDRVSLNDYACIKGLLEALNIYYHNEFGDFLL